MPIEHQGKKYFSEDEMPHIRRESDLAMQKFLKAFNESIMFFNDELQENAKFASRLSQQQDYILEKMKKHDEVLFGNGKDGVVTTMAMTVQTLKEIVSDLNDPKSGLHATDNAMGIIKNELQNIKAKEDNWDATHEEVYAVKSDVRMIKFKVAGIGLILGGVGSFLYTIIKKWMGLS